MNALVFALLAGGVLRDDEVVDQGLLPAAEGRTNYGQSGGCETGGLQQ